MPELRRDPIIGRWVIIAAERGVRPTDFSRPVPRTAGAAFCPFCPGNESSTPLEVLAYRAQGLPNSKGWSLRVVPNRFPALMIEGDLKREGVGLFDRMNG